MDNLLLLILLVFMMNQRRDRSIKQVEETPKQVPMDMDTSTEQNLLIKTNAEEFTLNIPQSRQKVAIMKKIGPYFPPEYISPINTAIGITEKILRLYEAIDFINSSSIDYIESPAPVANNKERVSYIINTIRDEVPREDIKNMGLALDIIFNMDKYKGMLDMLASFISDPDGLNDPKKILDFMEPFMEGRSEEEKKKIKEMAKVLEIFKNLDKNHTKK